MALFESLAELRKPLAVGSVDASARYVIRMHGKAMEAATEDERERLLAQAGGEAEAERVREEIFSLEERLRLGEAEADGLRTRLRLEVQSLLDNANLTPAATRDLAQSFLESRSPASRRGCCSPARKRLPSKNADCRRSITISCARCKRDRMASARSAASKRRTVIGWRGETLEAELSPFVNGLMGRRSAVST